MDNLEKLWCHSVITDEETCGKSIACSYAEDIACFITDKNFICTYQHHKLNSTGAAQKIVGNGKLKHVHYLSFYDTIFGATDFDFYVFGRHNFQIKFSYVTHKQIAQLCWNPMETALVVVFDDDDIAIYNFSGCNFELKHQTELHVSVSNSVYVGWGSRNTQFQGPRTQESTEEITRVGMSHEPPTLSWRNQGEQFVVNYYKDGKRFLKVFDKELNPLYMSDEYINLGPPVSFMPLGQCIAGYAVRNNINTVVIFEKNCKVKSTFDVIENKGEIRKLEYHSYMNMLAVYSIDNQNCGYINIYLCVNAQWYLKHQLFFPPNREVRYFQWVNMPEVAYTICKLVVFTSKNIEYHTFRFIINRCSITSIAAVINGPTIEFYKFNKKIAPPPIKLNAITFSKPVNQILFHPTMYLAVVLNSKLQASVVDVHRFDKLVETDDLLLPNIACFHHVNWYGTKISINLAYNSSDEYRSFKHIRGLLLQVQTFEMTAPQYVLPYNDTESLISHKILDDRFCALMYLTKKIITVDNTNVELDFALSSNQELYVNEKLVSCGITSLLVFQNYVAFTCVDSKLFCIRLLEDYNLFFTELDFTKIFSRDIEQGSRIITCTSSNLPQIVLQAPRGNFESVECRLIAIDVVENLLRLNDWKCALYIMRTGKVNWNVLIDLNPERFISHVEDFVKAADSCYVLCSIVFEFGNIDNSYNSYMPKSARIMTHKTGIIKKILEYLTSTNCVDNLMAIVAIQQKHISIKDALNSIKTVLETGTDDGIVMCKKSIKYLLAKKYFKDVLSAGYSFYSVDFLTFIYNHSTVDPRVFEAEVAELRRMHPLELRFTMNLKANNPKNALKYLLRCDTYGADFVESFILKHKLEAAAYHVLPKYYKMYSLVATLYANHLSHQRNHSEAAFVLSKAKLFPRALEEHKRALNWMEVVSLMNELQYNEIQKKEMLYELSEDLVRARRLDDAIFLLEHYIQDYEKVTQLLIEHNAFRKAIGFAKIHKLSNTIEQIILPNLTLYMENLNEKIRDYRATYEKYLQRLKLVREEKKNICNQQPHGIYEENDTVSDYESTTFGSSRGSSRSRGSTMSSKNRRKEDRKKTDLREGGYYEDIALMRALHLMYADVFTMGAEVADVCLIIEEDKMDVLKKIHEGLSQLQENMKNGVAEIWPDVFVNPPQAVDNAILAIIQNKQDLDPKYRNPPSDDLLNSKWKLEFYSSSSSVYF